jgi:hypothetical protein
MTKTCQHCDRAFTARLENRKYCSRTCYRAAHPKTSSYGPYTKRNTTRSEQGTCKADTGAISEAKVEADLLAHGFLVYTKRSTHGPDISAWHHDQGWLIEVKTGFRYNPTGRIMTTNSATHGAHILALCCDQTIRYINANTRRTITLDELRADHPVCSH